MAHKQLEERHARGVVVRRFRVHVLGQVYLGRHVGPRAARQRAAAPLELHGNAEVRQLEVTALVEQQVLGLDVAVQHAAAVHVLERRDERRGVEAHLRLREGRAQGQAGQRPRAVELVVQVAAQQQVRDDVEVALVLESVVQGRQLRALELREQPALVQHHVDAAAAQHAMLGQALHGVPHVAVGPVALVDDVHLRSRRRGAGGGRRERRASERVS